MASAKGKADNGEGDVKWLPDGPQRRWRMPSACSESQLVQAGRCVPWSLAGRNYALYEPAKAINSRSRIGRKEGRKVASVGHSALSRANAGPDKCTSPAPKCLPRELRDFPLLPDVYGEGE